MPNKKSLENLKKGKATQFKSGDPLAKLANSKGGKVAQQRRREKKEAQALLQAMTATKLDKHSNAYKQLRQLGVDIENCNHKAFILAKLMQNAEQKGDIKAINLIFDLLGETSREKRADLEIKNRQKELEIREKELEMKIQMVKGYTEAKDDDAFSKAIASSLALTSVWSEDNGDK